MIIDHIARSRFMSLLLYDYFNYVFSRNPTIGREAANFATESATEFAQTWSSAKHQNHIRITLVLIMLSVGYSAIAA